MNAAGSVFLAWLLAQLYKAGDTFNKTGVWKWKALLENGGMPSAHASVVAALSLTVFLETGFSLLFVVSVVFSLIVLNDALKVRRQASVHASLLSELLGKKRKRRSALSSSLGHTPTEVAVGLVLGMLVTWLMYTLG